MLFILLLVHSQTVQYEVKKQEHKQQEDAAEDDSFSQTTYETSELRKKLAQVESAITELISDLRFECESELLAMAAEN